MRKILFLVFPSPISPVFAHPRRAHLLARMFDLSAWKMEIRRLLLCDDHFTDTEGFASFGCAVVQVIEKRPF